jgi:hypothetical protein
MTDNNKPSCQTLNKDTIMDKVISTKWGFVYMRTEIQGLKVSRNWQVTEGGELVI